MAGIRRGQSARKKRGTSYHKALVALVLALAFCVPRAHAQTVEREDGTLIDSSASIGRDLFQDYVRSTKRLLRNEPPNTRVWVSSITGDSFGGVREILEGWTPDVHGVFTDNLDAARRDLATSFEVNRRTLAPTAQETDIIGGLWHLKALFESLPSSNQGDRSVIKTITIFSDMKNETTEFSMPKFLDTGAEGMLERARMRGLVVPLPHYKIFVYGASMTGLSPRSWVTINRFWELYFAAAGAELATYSPECAGVER